MEDIIYTGIEARLVAKSAYLTGLGHLALKIIAWYEKQPDNALAKDNAHVGFDLPGVFVEFDNTVFVPQGNHSEYSGKVTLHLVQDRIGIDAQEGGNTNLKAELTYLQHLTDILDGYKMACGAVLERVDQQRDHENRPLLWEKVIFSFKGKKKKVTVA